MTRTIIFAFATLVLLGGGFPLPPGQTTGPLAFGAAQAQTAEAVPDKSLVQEMTLGDENAPLTVIEYASFTCPHCKNFHKDTFSRFKANYIDTGKVYFIYREVYFDKYGLWAGTVARCGGGEKYFGISDLIYEQQSEWTKAADEAGIAENLARIGRTAGLPSDEVNACLQDREMMLAMIAVYQENAGADGIQSTPSFLIGGDLVAGNQSYEVFSALLDAKLGE